MKHLYLATPSYTSTVATGYVTSILMTAMACTKASIVLSGPDFKGGPYIEDNRNWLVHRFLKSDADTLIFLDDDITWDEAAVVKLYHSDHALCGGAYPKKQDDLTFTTKLLPNTHGEFHEAAWLPGGFMLIRRGVFEQMRPHVPSHTDESFGGERVYAYFQNAHYLPDGKVGEDVEFCNRWRALGGKVWCLPNIDFEHQGPKCWRGNLALSAPLALAPDGTRRVA